MTTPTYLGHTQTKGNADLDAVQTSLAAAVAATTSASAQWGPTKAVGAFVGRNYTFNGGTAIVAGVPVQIAGGSLVVADNAVSYVERTYAGVVSTNTVGFTSTSIALARVTAAAGVITLVEDWRPMLGPFPYYPLAPGEPSTVDVRYPRSAVAVDLRRFGPLGTGGVIGAGGDDTAAINAAIATGLHVDFAGLSLKASLLTSSTPFQQFVSSVGPASIVKNGNGDLWTSSGNYQEWHNIHLRGGSSNAPEFTGHGWVATGDSPAWWHCSSMWSAGRALKATGGHVQIYGTGHGGVWQTSDATGTGFDIEIGLSGVATLYHHLEGIYSSQSTGGILLTDVGEHLIVGGQYGKLSILKGTSPAGAGGGKTIGSRILGPIEVQLSGATIVDCHRGASATVHFALGTSGCAFIEWTVGSGAAITNDGNANSVILRNVSSGGVMQIQYGPDGTKAVMEADQSPAGDGHFKLPAVRVPNVTGSVVWENAAAGNGADVSMTVGGDWFLTNRMTGRGTTFTTIGATGFFSVDTPGGRKFNVNDTGIGLNGNAPVAKAAAITTPNVQTAAYVQADVASLKTAIDAIRVALTNIGVTL